MTVQAELLSDEEKRKIEELVEQEEGGIPEPDLAQGGGTNPEGVAAAIDAVKATIAAKVSS